MSRAVASANYGFEQQLSPTILSNASTCESQVPIHSMSPERVQIAMVNGIEMENSPATSSEGDLRGGEWIETLNTLKPNVVPLAVADLLNPSRCVSIALCMESQIIDSFPS